MLWGSAILISPEMMSHKGVYLYVRAAVVSLVRPLKMRVIQSLIKSVDGDGYRITGICHATWAKSILYL